MRLTHVSKKPVASVRVTADVGNDWKPKGFWYEVDGDWQRWCAEEEPEWIEGMLLYSVDLGRTNILKIRTARQLVALNSKYGTDDAYRPDWRRLAEKYDGLEISPYRGDYRLSEIRWYYTWDCASGVIWRPRGVMVHPLGTVSTHCDGAANSAAEGTGR